MGRGGQGGAGEGLGVTSSYSGSCWQVRPLPRGWESPGLGAGLLWLSAGMIQGRQTPVFEVCIGKPNYREGQTPRAVLTHRGKPVAHHDEASPPPAQHWGPGPPPLPSWPPIPDRSSQTNLDSFLGPISV